MVKNIEDIGCEESNGTEQINKRIKDRRQPNRQRASRHIKVKGASFLLL